LFQGGRGLGVIAKSSPRIIPCRPFRLTMYLIYNLRERGGDPPDKYLKSAELIARVSGYALLHR
jgi:hypothetical protein